MMKNYDVLEKKLSNGETIAYRHAGSAGENIILLHGNMSSSVFWQTSMEVLEGEFNIIAPDLRGFGDSTYNKPVDSLADFSEDISLLIDEIGLDKSYVLGWSTGGGVAMELAAMYPDKVKGIVLLDSVGVKGYPIFKKDEKGQPIFTELLSNREDIAADPVQVLPVLQAYEQKNKDVLRGIWDMLIYNMNKPEEGEYDIYLDAMLKQRNLVDVDYSLAHFNITDEHNGVSAGNNNIEKIVCPVLIIHGAKDLVVPVNMAHEMKAKFGDKADFVLIEHSGHSLITDDLDLFVETINKFIKKEK